MPYKEFILKPKKHMVSVESVNRIQDELKVEDAGIDTRVDKQSKLDKKFQDPTNSTFKEDSDFEEELKKAMP